MSNPIHMNIAILVCDTPLPPVVAKYGDYFAMFQGLLGQGFRDLDLSQEALKDVKLTFKEHQMVNMDPFPEIGSVDAMLITGSKHDAWADDPWILRLTEFIQSAVNLHNIPVVGVCFGHQILARALGAKVGRSDAGWEISAGKIDLTKTGKQIFGKDTLSIHQMHRDIVIGAPPAGCVNLATSSLCEIQGLYSPGRLLSVQGHPEFNEGIMSFILEARHDNGVFDDELYKDGLSRAGDHQDGRLIARTMAKFMLDTKITSLRK
ncbi:hypothetical protein N7452_000232 [Penicillium brevicompactum]|uniref:Glutamine amidotransferase domain-containing protein n=1 Tax=Penicillium brevicompactum TaxID=5074 RepID=A0A9W9R030_PENBR|nr:hypothetical protein N7452_000232 [Penicillium brevicompactum]